MVSWWSSFERAGGRTVCGRVSNCPIADKGQELNGDTRYVLCAGAGILGVSTALNALSEHAICTVWFSFVALLMTALTASVRTFANMSWVTWAGFISIYAAVFIIVIGVTTRDRPAAAPPTGDYDFGYLAVASPGFEAGITATLTIFISSAGTSAFMPVIAEMRRPQDFRKSLYICMSFVTASYLAFASVVYAWCGKWVASPALGSAGPTVKKVSYGIGLIGLIVSACLYTHVAAKYTFVRILRNSKHLQENTLVHWGTWLGCTFGLSGIAFVLASAIPIFNYLIALTASVCFAPLAMVLPGFLWLYDHKDWKKGKHRQEDSVGTALGSDRGRVAAVHWRHIRCREGDPEGI